LPLRDKGLMWLVNGALIGREKCILSQVMLYGLIRPDSPLIHGI